ncbi:hypothetical protein SAY87_015446 [Trapa incisa]|uniref:Dof zinc finger protein n=2 Tax=Trapa TaxID=22665 RepID=A0AAN7M549_TRANT|nr:hypothetical protein SAY87_015446 [Trapa incisa]KAK4802993.1 hypothetical protein SAY86_001196 [Trapa natans]
MDEKKDGHGTPSAVAASSQPGTATSAPNAPPPQEQANPVRCPRCDSPNTKFCYYNNYSLSQPRHFCKTCRRYWTKGGALRNVPIGGGFRKNKKLKTSSSRLSAGFDPSSSSFTSGAISSPSSANIPGFRFFQTGVSPAVDFQLGSLSSFPRLPMPPYPPQPFAETPTGQLGYYPSVLSSSSSPTAAAASAGLLFSGSAATTAGQESEAGSMNIQSSLASSIESLSSLNQDLHWKLQQQRLAMLLATSHSNSISIEAQRDAFASASASAATAFGTPATTTSLSLETTIQVVHRPQPVSFQSQEFMQIKPDNFYSRKQGESTATEWFFGNSYNTLIPDHSAEESGGSRSGTVHSQGWNGSNLQQQFSTSLP